MSDKRQPPPVHVAIPRFDPRPPDDPQRIADEERHERNMRVAAIFASGFENELQGLASMQAVCVQEYAHEKKLTERDWKSFEVEDYLLRWLPERLVVSSEIDWLIAVLLGAFFVHLHEQNLLKRRHLVRLLALIRGVSDEFIRLSH